MEWKCFIWATLVKERMFDKGQAWPCLHFEYGRWNRIREARQSEGLRQRARKRTGKVRQLFLKWVGTQSGPCGVKGGGVFMKTAWFRTPFQKLSLAGAAIPSPQQAQRWGMRIPDSSHSGLFDFKMQFQGNTSSKDATIFYFGESKLSSIAL